MIWNTLRIKKKQYGPDDLQHAIDRIEKFSPKRYVLEREMYYYNYGQIDKYYKPLLNLLNYISARVEKDESKEMFVQELFRKLKDFYDVNNKLSLNEALNDYNLLIKLRELFTIFYNDTKLGRDETNSYLRNLEKINLSSQ